MSKKEIPILKGNLIMSRYASSLVWIDLEMTGLSLEKDVILEIATVITDNNLNIIACGPSIVINQSNILLDSMDQWNLEQHTKSGLFTEVQASSISVNDAQQMTLDFLKQYCEKNTAPLCGNTVWQDRLFLHKYMPLIDNYLHYRIIDVSSIKELIRRWYGKNPENMFIKPENHRACEDIKYSIEELKFYKNKFFLKLT